MFKGIDSPERLPMKKDQIFLRPDRRSSNFAFDSEVAEVFDDMLLRSVPFYAERYNFAGFVCVKKSLHGHHTGR
jgi:hypothetical protein